MFVSLCRDHASQSVTSYPTRPLIGQNAQSQRGISEKSLRFLKPAVYRPTARFVRTQCKQSRRKPCVLFFLPRGIPLPLVCVNGPLRVTISQNKISVRTSIDVQSNVLTKGHHSCALFSMNGKKSLYTDWPLLWQMSGKSSVFVDIFQQQSYLQEAVKKLYCPHSLDSITRRQVSKGDNLVQTLQVYDGKV